MAQELPPDSGSSKSEKPIAPQEGFSFKIPTGTSPFSVWLIILTGAAAVVGNLLLAAYTWQDRAVKAFAVGTLMALAAAGIACVVGFLFGLPRYSYSAVASGSTIAAATEARSPGLYVPSNNLEQVSDWLTKLLLGAGLVQLGRVGRWLGDLIDELAGAFTISGTEVIPPTAKVLAASLLAFYSAFGFLSGYIVTSLWYRRRLQETVRHVVIEGGS